MKVVCDYCEAYIESTDEKCPNCGAPNTHFARTASDSPKTIEQLLDFCNKRNIPLEKLHMHIGENYQGPRAFGIYKDSNTGRFIVYKNKDSGERAIRYEGTDEAYAVNEIYMKVKDLVLDARENTATVNRTIPPLYQQPTRTNTPNRRPWLKWVIIGLIALFILGGGLKNIGRYLRPYFGSLGSSSSSSSYSSSTWHSNSNEADDSGGFFSNLFNGFDSDSDYDSDDSWFSSSDWDTDDDWDSGSDWDWSDSYDSYDYDSGYDWDSDW